MRHRSHDVEIQIGDSLRFKSIWGRYTLEKSLIFFLSCRNKATKINRTCRSIDKSQAFIEIQEKDIVRIFKKPAAMKTQTQLGENQANTAEGARSFKPEIFTIPNPVAHAAENP